MDLLPIDLIPNILSTFPLKSILEYRSINKTWREGIDILRSTNQLKKSAFLFLQRNSGKLYIVEEDDLHHFKSTRIGRPCPPNCSLSYAKPCNNGFLFFSSVDFEGDPCTFLYNPATRNYTKLPQFASPQITVPTLVPGLGVDPSSGEIKVVQMFCEVAQILNLGSKSWRKLENVPDLICFNGLSPVINGSLHWLTDSKCILSFDLATEKFRVIDLPQLSPSSEYSEWNFGIMDLGGCLSISDSSYEDHSEIWIMKHYNVKGSWIKINVANRYDAHGVVFENVVPISVMNNGDLVLLYGSRILVSYKVESGIYTSIGVSGIPGYKCGHQNRYEVHPYVGFSRPRVLGTAKHQPQT